MRTLHDTWPMTKRSLYHTFTSPDTIITVAITPIAMLLLFVFIFGSAFESLVPGNYINYITPGMAIMTVASGIAYAAFRLNNDLTNGILNRFRTMPIAQSSILNGHVISSVVSNLFSAALVVTVAFLIGFRSEATLAEWLLFGGILTLFTLATTWLAMIFGLIAKTAEGSGAFSYGMIFLLFVSSAFIPTDKMNPIVKAFAENQPMTPIIETLRSLATHGTTGDSLWVAIAWCIGILIISQTIALYIFKRKAI